MSNVQITNGTIKHGRTIKTGDFENKRGDVELSFNIPEGEDVDDAIHHVKKLVHKHLHEVLNPPAPKETAAPVAKAPKPPKAPAGEVDMAAVEKKVAKELPKAAEKAAADPSEVEDPLSDRAPMPAPKFIEKEVAAANAKASAADVEDENDISGLLGGEPAKEITDKELTDAVNKCMDKNKNAKDIHKLIKSLGIKVPPGRIIDVPQDKRQWFLDELLKIKPLA